MQQFTAAAGVGPGTFSGGSEVFVSQQNPEQVVLGDVDGDGDLDLLTANAGTTAQPGNTVSVRLNNGSGTFSGGSNVTVGLSPNSLALGDVDGDGDLDLLAANLAPNTVSVRLNDGSGAFSSGSNVAVGNGPCRVAAGRGLAGAAPAATGGAQFADPYGSVPLRRRPEKVRAARAQPYPAV